MKSGTVRSGRTVQTQPVRPPPAARLGCKDERCGFRLHSKQLDSRHYFAFAGTDTGNRLRGMGKGGGRMK